MSLLDESSAKFVIMERIRTPDGESGNITTWSEGAEIILAFAHDSTLQAQRAMQEGVTSVYTFLAPKNCGLEYHDVVKRKTDGQCFRITSNSGDEVTPRSSTLNLTKLTAEKWELTT